jgi:hypothetical protein
LNKIASELYSKLGMHTAPAHPSRGVQQSTGYTFEEYSGREQSELEMVSSPIGVLQ